MVKITKVQSKNLCILKHEQGEQTHLEIEMPELVKVLSKNSKSSVIDYNAVAVKNRLKAILDQEQGENTVSVFFNQSRDHMVFGYMVMQKFFESIQQNCRAHGTLISRIKSNLKCGPSTKEKIFNDACRRGFSIKSRASWNNNLTIISPTAITIANFLQDNYSNYMRVTNTGLVEIHQNLQKETNVNFIPKVYKTLNEIDRQKLGPVWSQITNSIK
jgi:hypothetical protein